MKRTPQDPNRMPIASARNGDSNVDPRDSFIALLAHELRNPLAPIRSGVALLKSTQADQQLRSDTLAMMERQLSHLVRLIDDLLASVSVRGRALPVTAERVRLSDVLNSAIASVRPVIAAKGQVLSLSETESTAMVDADPKRLAQAFSNLLNSGSKRAPWNGQVSVDLTLQDNVAVIRFSDNGAHIPDDELVDIFDLFPQAPNSISEGLGIGLALVRGLIEMNGGTVDAVDLSPDAGTSFIVTIPLRSMVVTQGAASAPLASGKPAGVPKWHSRRVLVVDDNRDAAQTLGNLLEFDGHTIRIAHDGPQAVAAAREFCPELVFMDIGLPGYSGLIATRKIRRLRLEVRPMIVALTGWGSAEDRRATQAVGCDLHLVKPIDYREITQMLSLVPEHAEDIS